MRPVRAVLAAAVLAASPALWAAPCAGFNDVSDSDPFCVYVDWMKNRGITFGLTSTQYDPAGFVTRIQMAAFMYRLGFQNAFLQGGNGFGAPAVIGTVDDQPLTLQLEGEPVMRYLPGSGSVSIVGGSPGNVVEGTVTGSEVIAGGGLIGSCTSGPVTNDCTNRTTDAGGSVISGGIGNRITGLQNTVAGGTLNRTSGLNTTISGGLANLAGGLYSAVLGGRANEATGNYATALGGGFNIASAVASIAGGRSARANQPACTVLNNWSSGEEASCNGWPYSFHLYGENGVSIDYNARLDGGFGNRWVHIGKQVGGQTIATWTGAYLSDTGQWQGSSDVARKQDFAEVDKLALLDQVLSLPVTSWRYRADPEGPRHVGPTAQDFNAAFGLGEGITTIGSIDANGVALAAIQGLNAKLETERAAKDAEIAALRAELVELRALRAELAAMRAAFSSSTVTNTVCLWTATTHNPQP